MNVLDSRSDAAAGKRQGLVIIGGGIHGATMLLEAARRGLDPLLIEKGRFGSATSASSLNVLHGGLRYLQSLDLPRAFESIAERRWYCRNFPDLVRPLACIMPLYDRGLRRRSVMRAALRLNDLLSRHRNRGVPDPATIPGSRILGVQETVRAFPAVDRAGLQGAALWHDAVMTDAHRLLLEIISWAESAGGSALDRAEAVGLDAVPGGDLIVKAVDHESGATLELRAPVVINCTGPWAGRVAAALDREVPEVLPSGLAFNVLLDREPLSTAAVAVEPRRGGRTYFLLPWEGRLLAGTYHLPWSAGPDVPVPDPEHVDAMLADLNQAVPGLRLDGNSVIRTLAGLIPARGAGEAEAAGRGSFIDHGRRGGAPGLYTVVGVKYTTARAVAERSLRRIYGSRSIVPGTERPDRTGR